MAKAGGETTTAWIKYGRAKVLASEYLGDSEFVERELLKGLAAGEIPWRCARFDAPEGYSGPGRDDPKFWKIDDDQLSALARGPPPIFLLTGIGIEGNSATRCDGAAAFGIELDRDALVKLKLLPPDDVGSEPPRQRPVETRSAKSLIEAEAAKQSRPQALRVLRVLHELGNIDGIRDPVVRQKVAACLQPEIKQGLRIPDRKTMNCAIRQYRNRAR